MSANELRQAAETLRANPYAVLRGNAPLVIAQALDRAAHQFEDAEHWPLGYIDWEAAADALLIDYTSVDFDGITYYVR